MTRFDTLTPDMFAVYVPEKWSSMVHNLPRMRNKDAMVALCQAAEQGLQAELAGLSRAASDEIPNIMNQKRVDAQRIFWFRDQAARAALASFLERTPLDQAVIFNLALQDKHVTLCVTLSHDALWVGLRLASAATVDRRNLAQKLAQAWQREALVDLLQELPEGAMLGFEGDCQPVSKVDQEALAYYAEQLVASDKLWSVGCGVSTSEAISLGHDIVDHVHRWLGALAGVYRFAAWTHDNDLIEASKRIQEDKAHRRRQATSFATGDRVRFIAGLFSGKIGVVQECDTKAQVKVRIGKMSVVVPGGDLTPAS